MTTFRHTHQLAQLRKLNNPAAAKATLLLKNGLPAMAAKTIKEAMQAALTGLTAPPSTYRTLTSFITSQEANNVPTSGKTYTVPGTNLRLYRRGDDIRLHTKGKTRSIRVAHWGQDRNNQSSYVGCWKLVGELTEDKFEQYLK